MRNLAATRILLALVGIFLTMRSLAAIRLTFIYMDIMIAEQGSCQTSWIKSTK